MNIVVCFIKKKKESKKQICDSKSLSKFKNVFFHHQFNLVWGSILASSGCSSLPIAVADDLALHKLLIKSTLLVIVFLKRRFNVEK
jgi:hypothetical protein